MAHIEILVSQKRTHQEHLRSVNMDGYSTVRVETVIRRRQQQRNKLLLFIQVVSLISVIVFAEEQKL